MIRFCPLALDFDHVVEGTDYEAFDWYQHSFKNTEAKTAAEVVNQAHFSTG